MSYELSIRVYLPTCLRVYVYPSRWYNQRNNSIKGLIMSKDSVQDGVVVSMEYTLHVDGELLDSSDGQGPLQFLVGYGNIIPGLENEMMGMKIGDSKKVIVQPVDGYGEFDEEAFMEVPRDQFPKDMKLEEGVELTVRDNEDNARMARVDRIEGDTVTLNFNHPLAGDELRFYVKVVKLREPNEEELEHGHVHEEGHHHH
jgi:FKBP-type peptidyl-prolyl cis-trans isomerase SlyD